MRNLRIDLCYDGTRYQGWQRLPKTENTIQGKLEAALYRILGETVEVTGSGRTDSGVHALRQAANVHCSSSMPCEEILSLLRRYLPEDIGIYSVRNVSDRFHARLNAKGKTYQYSLWYSGDPCVFRRKYITFYPAALDVAAMKAAAAQLVGTHDFSAFCANKHFKKSTVRTVFSIDIEDSGQMLSFRVSGNGFLHNMVRILVGTLVEVGEGKRRAEDIPLLFGAQRAEAGLLMPPHGLCLQEVTY